MRKIIAGLLASLWITAAAAQAPPPVPALPDTPRFSSYTISGTTCSCNVTFALYGDSTDYQNWVQVWVNGVQMAQAGNWTITSPTGPLATIPRPITDAVLTFTVAQTGTVRIEGARRPRRLSQFTENRGVAARDLNQAVTDLVAENREQWDALIRTISAPPGDTQTPLLLPAAATRASKFLGFDANGGIAVYTPGAGSGGNVTGPVSSTNSDFACFNGTTGLVIKDCALGLPIPVGSGGTGQITAPLARSAAGLNIDSYTAHGDSNYSIAATDRTVGTSAALTAARVWTLPAANAVNPGQTITVADYAAGVSSANSLTVSRAGSDTIVGGTTTTTAVLTAASSRLDLRSDGVSKWSVSIPGTTGTSALQTKTPLDYGALCDGTTDDSVALAAFLSGISSNAFVGWGLNGRTCRWKGLIPIFSGTTLYLNQMTLKLLDSVASGSNNFVCGPTTQLGGPITGLTIRDGVIDGNRANQTNTQGAGALLYCVSANNVYIENTHFINGRADGIDISGTSDSGGQGKSHNVMLVGVYAQNNYRNGLTIDGVDEMTVLGGFYDLTVNTNGNGPQCGIDAEPDDANGTNTNIALIGVSASGNGQAGFGGTGGTGICVYGANANTANLTIINPKGNSNLNYVVDSFSSSTPAQVTLSGSRGQSNGVAVYHQANIIDWLPSNVFKGAANSAGTGFASVGVPN